MRPRYTLATLRGDLFGGLTASVVGLPVALAFGVASGLGPIAGMYGAIAVGFFAAVFGGTRSQISGPTGPMSVAMAVIVTVHSDGDFAKAFTVVVLAGIIQIVLGAIRIGRFVAYTPHSVISGFMTGIGVIVMLVQVAPFVGAQVEPGGVLDKFRALPDAISNAEVHALIVASITLLVGVLWPSQARRYLPAPLAAMIVGSIIGIFWLNNLSVIGDVPTGLPELWIPVFDLGFLLSSLTPALVLALLGSIDSLLTSLIADSLTRTSHNANRELVGQGIGNTVAGFIGGLPGAGATLGTVINIRSGGRTPFSGVVRAGVLLALVLGLGRYATEIPHAVLAGILMKVGWDIIDWRLLKRAHRIQRDHLIVMLITLALTVFLDLVTAIAIGLIAAGMVAARQVERQELDSVVSTPLLDQSFLYDSPEAAAAANDGDEFAARVGVVGMRGRFSVASSSKLVNTIGGDIRDHDVVIFDFSETLHMDDSAAMVVEQMIDIAHEEDTESIIMGLSGSPVERNLTALNILAKVPEDRFVADLDGARAVARNILNITPEPAETA
ncbi:MAG: SulP family inorganic anion transporter [Chloroflexi bacterium]|nr:SulP family inorganic anion transporter [Chloroflexota bacterium]MYD47897.1 SulP family inorganic anion transporter [Chloroflexota bacterium]